MTNRNDFPGLLVSDPREWDNAPFGADAADSAMPQMPLQQYPMQTPGLNSTMPLLMLSNQVSSATSQPQVNQWITHPYNPYLHPLDALGNLLIKVRMKNMPPKPIDAPWGKLGDADTNGWAGTDILQNTMGS